ncbi:drebrin isoform X2 [Hemicordylus capensis]|uniref:drebrin isoform X2 n=1 Tax=Hemicordylus capensis TaxID=884348 RepID=UPI00230413E5|nr:drebrin isoform X2 [Hemicordylus capensis]
MAGVSFSVNRLELLASYQEVIGEDSPTDWALYTYEDDSDNLKLAASGTGGLQELSSHFENQKVMYGFCSVKDPQATLPKYVLVNWVGEDVADARKCACASHVAKVAEFFQGVDVIVNASSVEDIDPGAIGQRLSNGLARVASPVLHRLRLREDENTQPVGTTYQKTDAAVEMKRLNREQFWEQAKKEEELRKEEERKKALDERLRFEQERMEQERQEQEEREKRYREREEQIEEHRRKQQSLEAEEAKQRLKEPSIFGEQEDEEDRQQPKKSESEVEEAAAIIAQRPENPREFFRQQERVASASSETPPPVNRTGRLHCPFIKAPDSGPPSSSSSSSSPPRTPFPYITCHRTPNLSSFFPCSQTEMHRKASASTSSPCDSSTASTPVGEQIDRALDEVTQQQGALKDSSSPSSEETAVASAMNWAPPSVEQPVEKAEEPPGASAWQGADWTEPQVQGGAGPTEDLVSPESKEEPLFPEAPPPKEELLFPAAPLPMQSEGVLDLGEAFGFSQPPAPPSENILDLWQNDSTAVEPTPPDAWELQGGPPTPAPWDLHDGPPAPAPMLVEVDVPPGAPEPPSSAGLAEDNLLNFNDLPEPPATFCDAEQDEEPASIIAIEGLHQMTLSYQHALQEASGVSQEPQLLTNGETAQKESTQTSEGYFSQSQDEDFNQSEEPSAKAPPPVFYNKPPEIDITCWDADPVPEDEESFGGSV